MRVFKLMVGGKSYEIEVGDLTRSPVTVKVNGRVIEVEFEAPGRLVQPSHAAPRSQSAPAHSPTVPPVSQAGVIAPSLEEVIAPMPGKVLDVRVGVGDKVEHSEELCVLEAMKMGMSIKAPMAGVIKEVRVSVGQTVAYGDVLFILE